MAKEEKRDASLRPLEIRRGINRHAEGSALISMGRTTVICTASVEERVPDWLRGQGRGWITAEYGMLPRSTSTRMRRDRDKLSSRSLEIGRFIGRALRASTDLRLLGERTVTVDCDVVQADGGTRTAAITGGMVALADAMAWLRLKDRLQVNPIRTMVAAVSVGIVDGAPVLDLDYEHDHRADVDMNVAMTEEGMFVEIQAAAEGAPFSDSQFELMKKLAAAGIKRLIAEQKKTLAAKRRRGK